MIDYLATLDHVWWKGWGVKNEKFFEKNEINKWFHSKFKLNIHLRKEKLTYYQTKPTNHCWASISTTTIIHSHTHIPDWRWLRNQLTFELLGYVQNWQLYKEAPEMSHGRRDILGTWNVKYNGWVCLGLGLVFFFFFF